MSDSMLLQWYFFNSLLVASTFKFSGKILVHNLACSLFGDKASGHDQHVGIVVLSYQMGYLWTPAQAGSYLLVLVQCHGNAFAAATDGYARIHFAALYAFSQCVAKIGIVAAVFRQGAIVFVWVAFLIEILLYKLLQLEAGMVAG